MCIQTLPGPTLHKARPPGQAPAAQASGAQQKPGKGLFWEGAAPCQGLAGRRELIIFKRLSEHLLVDTRAKQRLCPTCCAEQQAACSACRAAHKINFQQLLVLWPKNLTWCVHKAEQSYRTPTAAAAPNAFKNLRNLVQTPLKRQQKAISGGLCP